MDDEGKLGLRILGPGLWRKEFTIRQILLDIQLLLLDPGTGQRPLILFTSLSVPDTSTWPSGGYPLVPGVRDIFKADLDQFNRVARVWTRRYAGYRWSW